MIHRFRRELLRLMVSEIQNVLAGDFGQVRIGKRTEMSKELIRSLPVKFRVDSATSCRLAASHDWEKERSDLLTNCSPVISA